MFPEVLVAMAHQGIGTAIVADDAIAPEEAARASVVTGGGRPLSEATWLHWRSVSDPAVAAFLGVVGEMVPRSPGPKPRPR
jgi:DNA-binding transcriptional LysR family regulator